jgi:hypothetical protein
MSVDRRKTLRQSRLEFAQGHPQKRISIVRFGEFTALRQAL